MAEGFSAEGASNYATWAANQCINAKKTIDETVEKVTKTADEASSLANSALTTANKAASMANDVKKGADNGEFIPNISIGNVSTVEPDQPASVSKSGTVKNPILNFSLPRGHDATALIDDGSVTSSKIADGSVSLEKLSESLKGVIPFLDEEGLLTLANALPIESGGTGATNAAAARSNLDAAATTHDHGAADIKSGTLPVALGGTGQTSLQATRNAMGLGNTTGVLPIANGGTGTNSSDPVIASGTSGNWHYVKFNSGLAICELKQTYTLTAADQWGDVHAGPQVTLNAYPFAFVDVPTTIAQSYTDGNSQFWLTGMNNGTKTTPPRFKPHCSFSRSNTAGYVCFIAIGRWK